MLPPHDAFRERVSRKDGSIGRQKTIESDAVTDLAALRRLIDGMFSADYVVHRTRLACFGSFANIDERTGREY
ncbi:hypothetical protein [Caballeronia sp. AZ10_KS36]|uniref:hypothetical protein n=1 Tax=Caballeronia sp. AZ10_KS36 TaxID=2921757 RepID=UPI002027A5A4|nr:hypothetical protein [Caballeronia sp. AZ10_KS36]